jgi:hypothetical protein
MRRLILFIGAALFASACRTPPTLYEWGDYEDSVAHLFRGGEAANGAEKELAQLEQLAGRSRDLGKPPPPGLLAHIGYLHAESGDLQGARAYFSAEKEAWPVSAKFMDRLIAELER